jgi:hypothetical protein
VQVGVLQRGERAAAAQEKDLERPVMWMPVPVRHRHPRSSDRHGFVNRISLGQVLLELGVLGVDLVDDRRVEQLVGRQLPARGLQRGEGLLLQVVRDREQAVGLRLVGRDELRLRLDAPATFFGSRSPKVRSPAAADSL